MNRRGPVSVAVANDYDLVVEGTATVLGRFPDQVVVADRLVIGEPIVARVDVALYDTYGRRGVAEPALRELALDPLVGRVAVFSLDLNAELLAAGREAGATGFISKALSAQELVAAIVEVADGRDVVATTPSAAPVLDDLDWPAKTAGLTERESAVLVLVAEGLTNREVAEAMMLSAETVKSYLSQVYAKIGVRNRVEAAAYAHRSGAFRKFQPAEHLLDGAVTVPERHGGR